MFLYYRQRRGEIYFENRWEDSNEQNQNLKVKSSAVEDEQLKWFGNMKRISKNIWRKTMKNKGKERPGLRKREKQ